MDKGSKHRGADAEGRAPFLLSPPGTTPTRDSFSNIGGEDGMIKQVLAGVVAIRHRLGRSVGADLYFPCRLRLPLSLSGGHRPRGPRRPRRSPDGDQREVTMQKVVK